MFKDESLLKSNAIKVMQLLFNFLQQYGADEDNRSLILSCMCSWIRSGSIPVEILESSGLVSLAFEVLQTPATFDIGTDIICELIVTSSAVPRRDSLIQSIYPNLIKLVVLLKENIGDGDIVRGICRILVEAGEA